MGDRPPMQLQESLHSLLQFVIELLPPTIWRTALRGYFALPIRVNSYVNIPFGNLLYFFPFYIRVEKITGGKVTTMQKYSVR